MNRERSLSHLLFNEFESNFAQSDFVYAYSVYNKQFEVRSESTDVKTSILDRVEKLGILRPLFMQNCHELGFF